MKGCRRFPGSRERGITLIEVLVGFVIFSASMVAVLDYVGEQVYQIQRSSKGLETMQAFNETALALRFPGVTKNTNSADQLPAVDTGNPASIGKAKSRRQVTELVQHDLTLVADRAAGWSVISLQQVR